MPESVKLTFSGSLETEQLDISDDRAHVTVQALREQSELLTAVISNEITVVVGVPPRVTIEFRKGSIEWYGLVEWVQTGWPTIEVMATIGGALSLIQLVRSAVNRVLQHFLADALGMRNVVPYLETRVVLVSVPHHRALRSSFSVSHLKMFGIAAIIAALAALVASLGILIWAVRG